MTAGRFARRRVDRKGWDVETIVVGLDGSKSAGAAARWTAREAKQRGARVVAVHAIPKTELWGLSAIQVDTDELRAALRDSLEHEWVAPLSRAKVPYTTQFLRGDPAAQLLRVALRVDASLLVLGSKGHGTLTDLVVGGTVHKVINRSPIPVVLVPSAPARKRSADQRPTRPR